MLSIWVIRRLDPSQLLVCMGTALLLRTSAAVRTCVLFFVHKA